MKINAHTKPTYILGNPVSHSKSPLMHNAAFEYLNYNSVYLALEIAESSFETAAAGLKQLDITGLNITIPYKKKIMDFTDSLNEDAEKIGAVNTVVALNGEWKGYNTDWYGVYKTLENNNLDKNLSVLIIGAGGAANGVVYGLAEYGYSRIAITNRTKSRAESIASLFGIDLMPFDTYREAAGDYQLIVNCTTLDFDTLFDTLDNEKIYFDLKYYTKDMNVQNFINGSQMLLYQGAKAFELWTGLEAPLEVMAKALNG